MIQKKIIELLDEMTLEEKIGQLIQINEDDFKFVSDSGNGQDSENDNTQIDDQYYIGSVINCSDSQKMKKIQDDYLSKSRLGIPLLFMADIVNGYKTIFPIPLLQGCSWDTDLIKKCNEIAAKEALLAGIGVNLSPMVDLVRDCRWGRVLESTGGEDPYLGSLYAKSIINGNHRAGMATCVKHFVGAGSCNSGMDYNCTDMSERELRQYYFPAYKTAIEADTDMVMTSYNSLNGVPCSGNDWLLNDILRKEWKFNGVVISGYQAIAELVTHGYSKNDITAAYNALNSNIDIDMVGNIYQKYLLKLFNKNKITIKEIDEVVLRILNLKNKLGLFESPYGKANQKQEKIFNMSTENLEASRELAANSFVLLKNNHKQLPLTTDKKIALIGPYSNSVHLIASTSLFHDDLRNITTLKQVFESKIEEKNLSVFPGSELLRENEINDILSSMNQQTITIENEQENEKALLEEALAAAQHSDVIVLAIGEHYLQSGEGASRANIDLPGVQKKLINKLYKTGKPIVGILFSGRPISLGNIIDKFESLIWVGFPGSSGANAIGDVIFGDVNPCGRLNMSFPYTVGQCPIYYNHYNSGRPNIANERFSCKYMDYPSKPLFNFGYGLSYCDFSYTNLQLSSDEITDLSPITATVTVTNESDISGYEIVQLYIQDLYGNVVRPVKELKDFKKEYFAPHEQKEITFSINIDMLKFWDANMNYIAEPGNFKVYIGPDSENNLEAEFTL